MPKVRAVDRGMKNEVGPGTGDSEGSRSRPFLRRDGTPGAVYLRARRRKADVSDAAAWAGSFARYCGATLSEE